MDISTCAYYRNHPHNRLVNNLLLQDCAIRYTDRGMRVLDVACGCGWLSQWLMDEGRVVTACDLYVPRLGNDIKSYAAQFPIEPDHALWGVPPFGTLTCVAMLMHLPDVSLLRTLRQFRNLLADGGHLLISVCHGGRELDGSGHDERGVYYAERPLCAYEAILERLGFQTVERRVGLADSLGRAGIHWDVWVGVLNHREKGNGVDHAVSLIHHDSKTATYKLALLRALTDIALDRPHQAFWRVDGGVAVPLQDVVDLWIRYYNPLLESGVPQIQRNTRVAFSTQWESTRWLRTQERLQNRALRRQIATTILKGPVAYSKGVANGPLFQFDKVADSLLIPGELWKELGTLGHWIRDSLLMEWARLSASFAEAKPEMQRVKVAEYLAILMQEDENIRYTEEARKLYGSNPETLCTWTGNRLSGTMHIDHLIPFSQWATNAWWNLVPASGKANLAKSDKLPSASLLNKSRARIIPCWQMASERESTAFEVEIRRDFLGKSSLANWETVLYDALCERVETLGEARGLMFWDGLQN